LRSDPGVQKPGYNMIKKADPKKRVYFERILNKITATVLLRNILPLLVDKIYQYKEAFFALKNLKY